MDPTGRGKDPGTESRNDRLKAALLTLVAALLLLALLLKGRLSVQGPALAKASTAELMSPEELFIEPEIVELGEETSHVHDKAAPSLRGNPEPAEHDNSEIIDPGPEPEPKPKPVRNEVTQSKESRLQQEEAARIEKERKQATSTVADKFGPRNGNTGGSDKGTSGSASEGAGIKGVARGRTFMGCPAPDVSLRHKTTVRVDVVIDASGNVTEATAAGSASAAIRGKCVAAARQARWSAKKGASPTRGSITFTITPR